MIPAGRQVWICTGHTDAPPDYSVILDDGDQWLVEVKNVREDDPTRQVAHLSATCLASLNAHCDLMRAPVDRPQHLGMTFCPIHWYWHAASAH